MKINSNYTKNFDSEFRQISLDVYVVKLYKLLKYQVMVVHK